MKRDVVASTWLALAAALALGACDGEASTSYPAIASGGAGNAFCSSSLSCAACTPRDGCGWCYDSDGTGQCVSSPTECRTQVFDWTWNPDGCRVPAQAGIFPREEAGTSSDDAGMGAEDADNKGDTGDLLPAGDASAPNGVAPSACLGPAPADASDASCVVETP